MSETLSSFPPQNPSSSSTWPEGAPSVSVDINAGNDYSQVDVDPVELMRELDMLGISVEDRKNVSIKLHNGTSPQDNFSDSLTPKTRGKYIPNETEGGVVQLALGRNDKDINQTLTHELTHLRQDLEGTFDTLESVEERRRKFIKAALGATATVGAFSLAVINSGAGDMLPDPLKMVVNAGTVASVPAFGIAGGAALEYHQRPTEKEARKVAADYSTAHSTITTVKNRA